jgi:hypothetical protein
MGNDSAARQGVAIALGILHKCLQGFDPGDKESPFHDVAKAITTLSKHAHPDPEAQKTGKMPQMAAPPPGAPPPGAMPPMNPGGAQGAMAPRGPAAMPAGAPMQ